MNNTIVVYKSKYGATEQYAAWLKEELNCVTVMTKQFSADIAKDYDTIIFAGGIYGGTVNGLKVLKKYGEELKNKRVIILGVGASVYDEKGVSDLKALNLKDTAVKAEMFCVQGELALSKMKFFARFICKFLQKMKAKENGDYESIGKDVDMKNKESLTPLIEYVKNI